MDTRLPRMVDLLLERTKQGQVAWRKGLSQGDFEASFSDFSVEVDERLRKADALIFLRLFNHEGVVIESFSSQDMRQAGYDHDARKMEELYSLARRKALGVDEVLEHILHSLERSP